MSALDTQRTIARKGVSDDVNPGRRAEYESALAVLGLQIVGLRSVGNDIDLSGGALSKITEELNDRVRRHGLLTAALDQLNGCNDAHKRLLEDGYPDLPRGIVSQLVLEELHGRREAVEAAIGQFDSVSVAVELGKPVDKT